MANTKFTGRSDSYIFEDAGGKREISLSRLS